MIDNPQNMSLRQMVGQLFFIGIAGPDIDAPTRDLLAEISPGGVCLFARNIREAVQTRALLDEIRTLVPVTPILSVDQEGGLVDRLRRIVTPMPAPGKIGSADEARRLGSIIAETLRILGFNMDFAPVVDVIDATRGQFTNGLATRAFGSSKTEAVTLAGEFLGALQSGGITACIKHFPGLAAARVDSHEELPMIEISEDELEATDLFPYRELLATGGVHAVMVAHAGFPHHSLQERDQNGKLLPSSLSNNFVNGLLRGQLGYNGLVVTDDLEMGAIIKNYGIGMACNMAISAGVDMPLICADPQRIREGHAFVLEAVERGEIDIERIKLSLGRIADVKSTLFEPTTFDTVRLHQLSDEIAVLNAQIDLLGGMTRFA